MKRATLTEKLLNLVKLLDYKLDCDWAMDCAAWLSVQQCIQRGM